MNTAQLNTLRRLSTSIERRHHDGAMAYSAEALAGGTVLFTATNVHGELRWFETTTDLYALVGPRGGVRPYAGTLKNATL